MKVFWDTSAAINALVSSQVFSRLNSNENFARTHLLSEFFAIMTGRGIQVLDQATQTPVRLLLQPKDAATWLRTFAGKVTFIDLSANETLDALDKTQTMGLQGGKVYDYGHALAADKARAEQILTRDVAGFVSLTQVSVEWP